MVPSQDSAATRGRTLSVCELCRVVLEEESGVVYQDGTASDDDTSRVVSTIEQKRIAELAHQVVVGDYKTPKNRLCLKHQQRETTKRLCPAPGEWH
jgi:hypothetical protein